MLGRHNLCVTRRRAQARCRHRPSVHEEHPTDVCAIERSA
jgi:hypothetical protein